MSTFIRDEEDRALFALILLLVVLGAISWLSHGGDIGASARFLVNSG